jgi:hypothetical protein
MLNRRSLVAAMLSVCAVAAGAGVAQGQPVVGIQTVTSYYADGRISAVDPKARTVTVTFPNGSTRTHDVSPAVVNFSATRIGDAVTVGFEDRLTFVLSGPRSSMPRESNDVAAGAIARGQRVAGIGAAETIDNWWVVGVDPNAGTVTLVDPESGPVRTFKVTTQAGREQLPRVKIGDGLTAINNQVLVISIGPRP